MTAITPAEFRQLRGVIYDHCGLTFADDMGYLFENRLGPRLAARGLSAFSAYHDLLRHGPDRGAELEAAVEALATHETYLFREPRQLRAFAGALLPLLAAQNERRRRLRVWSAGCSTGEEVYTVAALLLGSRLFEGWDVEVFGSDLVRRVLDVARAGVYGPAAFRSEEAEELRGWFHEEGGRWNAREELRRVVRFGHQNLVQDGCAGLHSPVDVVFCRNVLIYFDLAARRRVVNGFRERLRDGGYLLLGHAESLLHVTPAFDLVRLQQELVYRKREERS